MRLKMPPVAARQLVYKHVCPICDKAFPHSEFLRRHQRAHTNERPYACETCDKAFKVKSDLHRHHRTHTKEKVRPDYGLGTIVAVHVLAVRTLLHPVGRSETARAQRAQDVIDMHPQLVQCESSHGPMDR